MSTRPESPNKACPGPGEIESENLGSNNSFMVKKAPKAPNKKMRKVEDHQAIFDMLVISMMVL
jgi:hypothetical protein